MVDQPITPPGDSVTLPSGTEISFYQSAGRPAARYASGSTVYEEALEHGRWIGLYWSAGGQVQRENVTATLPGLESLAYPLHTFELQIDGQSLHNLWEWVGSGERPGRKPGTVEAWVELRHQVRPVQLRLVTRLDGSPILTRWLEITNTGAAPAALAAVAPWAGVLWRDNPHRGIHHFNTNPSFDAQAEPRYVLGYFASDDALLEGDLAWQPLDREGFRIERKRHGRTWGSPYYIVRNQATGEMFFLALAWGAGSFAEFTQPPDRELALLAFHLGPLAPAPLRLIEPGETVASPEVHLGPLHGDLDGAVSAWHTHLRRGVLPARPKGKEMFTIAGRVVEEPGEWILREIDLAAEMGVEGFMVDAGWYGDTFGSWVNLRGDWQEGSWLPGGLAGVRQYAHSKGLLFGLWHEAETVTEETRLAKEHPDWIMRTDEGRQVTAGLDLANPEAARFFEETVLGLIGGHQLDFYKLDYNIDPMEGGQTQRDGYAENEAWRHYEVLYRTYNRVRAELPEVCLENCASGGGRNDLGMLSRFHYASHSDYSVLPYSIRAINAMTLFLPPEALCYYHNHINLPIIQAHHLGDADTHLRVALFASPIFVGFGGQEADRGSEFFRKTRRYIELIKGFCRPVMAGGAAVYHHTPEIGLFSPADWCVLEYGAPDRSRGYAGCFKLSPGRGEYSLRLRGVDWGAAYRVTLDNRQQTWQAPGSVLAQEGLVIVLDSALTSELVMYEKI